MRVTQGMVYVIDFSANSNNALDPSQASNCYHNTTTGYYHCLDIWQLGSAFTPHAIIIAGVDSLYL